MRFFILVFFIFASTLVSAKKIDKNFEAKVLDTIQANPKFIVDVLVKYRQEEALRESQEKINEMLAHPYKIDLKDTPVLGKDKAKYTLVIFSDFQCPYCKLAQATIQELKGIWGDDLRVAFKHLPLSFHENSRPAALAAYAAYKQGKFWEYHDILWNKQENLGEELYLQSAQDLSLDLDKFNFDRASQAAQDYIEASIALAKELEIDGTPAFFFNGIKNLGLYEADHFVDLSKKLK